MVEKWNAFTKQRQDLFGFADILALKEGQTPLLVQTTSGGGVSSRIKKILEHENYPLVSSIFDVHVHGWRKIVKVKGKPQRVWAIRLEVLNAL